MRQMVRHIHFPKFRSRVTTILGILGNGPSWAGSFRRVACGTDVKMRIRVLVQRTVGLFIPKRFSHRIFLSASVKKEEDVQNHRRRSWLGSISNVVQPWLNTSDKRRGEIQRGKIDSQVGEGGRKSPCWILSHHLLIQFSFPQNP